MPATKISDLLPLPDSITDPHPYQVFGLEDGEQDTAKISKAIRGVVANLKSVKKETDPKLWAKAAKLVQTSRVTLANAESKAQLDARFGIIAEESETPPCEDPLAGVLPTADPLASLLPASDPTANAAAPSPDPLAAILPAADPSAAPATGPQSNVETPHSQPTISVPAGSSTGAIPGNSMPAGVFGTPAHTPGPSESVSAGNPVVIAAEDHKRAGGSRAKRRRKPMLGVLMFGTFAVGMLALIGTLIYFLVFGPGTVAITNSGGQLTISTEPEQEIEGPLVSPPRDVNQQRPKPQPLDPVMGNLSGDMAAPSTGPSELATQLENSGQTASPPMTEDGDAREDSSMSTDRSPAMETSDDMEMSEPPPVPTEEDVAADPNMDSEPPMETDPAMDSEEPEPPLTDEMIAQVDEKLIEVSLLIKSADWAQMKPAAEALTEMRMTDEQSGHAEALYELADLASYYRGGIAKAVKDLEIGNDFAITDDFRVIVVEKGDDLLVVRYSERNRSWSFDEFPFSLAHKLASFAVPESPTREAAKAVYQAVAPKTSPEYRAESVRILEGIRGEVEGADPKRLAETVQALFNDGA